MKRRQRRNRKQTVRKSEEGVASGHSWPKLCRRSLDRAKSMTLLLIAVAAAQLAAAEPGTSGECGWLVLSGDALFY